MKHLFLYLTLAFNSSAIAQTITEQPKDTSVCSGSTTMLSVTATGTGLSYQWQKKGDALYTNLSNASPYSGVNTATLSVTGVASDDKNTQYRCVISSGGTTVQTRDANVKVIVPHSITEQPHDASAPAGGYTTFKVKLNEYVGVQFQWQESDGGAWHPIEGGAEFMGTSDSQLKLKATVGRNNYNYRCVITGRCGSTVTSNSATLHIE